jgi:hypothetical protein
MAMQERLTAKEIDEIEERLDRMTAALPSPGTGTVTDFAWGVPATLHREHQDRGNVNT